jgi:hypothetical protein
VYPRKPYCFAVANHLDVSLYKFNLQKYVSLGHDHLKAEVPVLRLQWCRAYATESQLTYLQKKKKTGIVTETRNVSTLKSDVKVSQTSGFRSLIDVTWLTVEVTPAELMDIRFVESR